MNVTTEDVLDWIYIWHRRRWQGWYVVIIQARVTGGMNGKTFGAERGPEICTLMVMNVLAGGIRHLIILGVHGHIGCTWRWTRRDINRDAQHNGDESRRSMASAKIDPICPVCVDHLGNDTGLVNI